MTTSKDVAVLVDDDQLEIDTETKTTTPRISRKFIFRGHVIEGFNLVILSVVVFSLATTISLLITLITGVHEVIPHSSIHTEDPICSDKASLMMKSNTANAIDAVVFSFICQFVTRPDVTSAFGCGSILVHDRENQTSYLFDFSCPTPSGESKSDFGISGMIQGLEKVHTKFGKMKWEELFEYPIELANNGFSRSQHFKQSLEKNKMNSSNSEPPNVNLSRFLKMLSIDPMSIHAPNILSSLKEATGTQTIVEDFHSYLVKTPAPYSFSMFGYTFETFPLPWLNGPFTHILLGMLQNYLTSSTNKIISRNDSGLLYHRLVEATKITQFSLNQLGDPNNAQGVSLVLDHLTSNEYLASQSAKISDSMTHPDSFYGDSKLGEELMKSWTNIGDSLIMATDANRYTVLGQSYMGKPFGLGTTVNGTGQYPNSGLSLFPAESTNQTDSVKTFNKRSPRQTPLIPLGSIYYRTLSRKCGVRGGIGSSGGISGLFDTVQSLVNTMFLLQKVECKKDDLPDAMDSSMDKEMATSYQKDCWPIMQGVKIPKVAVLLKPRPSNMSLSNDTFVSPIYIERTMDIKIVDYLKSIYSDNVEFLDSKSWQASTSTVGWNGYSIFHGSDSPPNFMVNF